MDHASKNLRIHEAHISKGELKKVIDGIKTRIQEFLDNLILVLEWFGFAKPEKLIF